jgi:hypothetical protein
MNARELVDIAAEQAAWTTRGRAIAQKVNVACWEIGDWILEGEAKWGDHYTEAAEITGFTAGSLKQYAYVARRFDSSNRFYKLGFHHHALVAAIPKEAAEQWLELAEAEQWSVRDLQAALRTVQQLPPGKPEVVVTVFKVTVPNEHEQCWRVAAQRRGLEVEEWIVVVADEAAQSKAA